MKSYQNLTINLNMRGDGPSGSTAAPHDGEVISLHSQSGDAEQDPVGEDPIIGHLEDVLVEYARRAISVPEVVGHVDAILESVDGYNTAQWKATRDRYLEMIKEVSLH